MLENRIPLREVISLYIKTYIEWRAYWYANEDLDKTARSKPEACYIFMDGYDLCDLFYPQALSQDLHYETVNSLWWEFIAQCHNKVLPFKVYIVIPPGAAYEVMGFAHEVIKQGALGFEPIETTTQPKPGDYQRALDKNWSSYLNLKPFLTKDIATRFSKLAELYDAGKFVEFSKVAGGSLLANQPSLFEQSKCWLEFDYSRGMNTFNIRRPDKFMSNEVDMYNFMTGIRVSKEDLHRNNLLFVTSHSGHTLTAWADSWLGKITESPGRSSLSANIMLTALVKEEGDPVKARNFVASGHSVAMEIASGLELIPEIKAYKEAHPKERKKMKTEMGNRFVDIPYNTVVDISYWMRHFARDRRWKASAYTSETPDYGLAVQLGTNGDYRQRLKHTALINAKHVFAELAKKGILDLNSIFIPEDPICEDMLLWLMGPMND